MVPLTLQNWIFRVQITFGTLLSKLKKTRDRGNTVLIIIKNLLRLTGYPVNCLYTQLFCNAFWMKLMDLDYWLEIALAGAKMAGVDLR